MVFIIIMVLLLYPIFSFALLALCSWSTRCKRCRKYLNSKMYYNTYVRIGLEVTLELSISSFIRMRFIAFDTNSEIFHSVFTFVALGLILAIILLAGLYP